MQARETGGDDHVTTLSPAVRRAVLEYHLDPSQDHAARGKDGRLTKDDVLAAAKAQEAAPPPPPPAAGARAAAAAAARRAAAAPASAAKSACG